MQTRRLRNLKVFTLATVALIGAALSYTSLYEAAKTRFPWILPFGFPLLVDALILGALAAYIHSVKVDRPLIGWRYVAHVAVAGTMYLNWLAAPGDFFHLVAPAVWSVICELTAREVLGERRAVRLNSVDTAIPLRLWMSAPIESFRTWLLIARLNILSHVDARVMVVDFAAARIALRTVEDPQVRRVIARRLRAGLMTPQDVLTACGWASGEIDSRQGHQVLQAALTGSVPAPETPSDLGESDPSVPGQGQEPQTKREWVLRALDAENGDVKKAVAWLKERDVSVTDSYAYTIKRSITQQSEPSTVIALAR